MQVYVIVCSETLKIYVGQHKFEDLNRYFQQKWYDAHRYSGKRSHLYHALRKHPRESWSIHPLVSGIEAKAELDETERLLIYALKCQHPDVGYNICDGGEGFTGPFTEAHRAKLRAASLGHVVTEETRAKIKKNMSPKPPEFGAVIRKALTGRTWTPEQRAKIPNGIKSAIHEGRMKIHQWTPEERERQRAATSISSKRRHLLNFIKTVAWG